MTGAGLTTSEAQARLREHGPNELRRDEATPAWVLLAAQLKSPIVWLIGVACVVALALGQWVDAAAIGAIVVLNALVGFFQEHRAERAILALRSMTAPRARVLRDGRTTELAAAAVVPGDVLVLEAGDIIAADGRLLEAHALAINEAPLTGESAPVDKRSGPPAADAPLAERRSAVFMGTSVTRGTGLAEVTATGMTTELGRIAHLVTTAQDDATPLQRRLARVTRVLLYLCLGIVAVVAALGLVRGVPAFEVFLYAVSLAVAAVPEGLPAVVTIALAIGVQRMARRHVLVRRLSAVETLGCATVICTDKTGTLTTGVMTVREVWGADRAEILAAAAACCDADLSADHSSAVGDPTEVALVVAAAASGFVRDQIEQRNPRVEVHPFDAERKRMSILRADGVLYTKGAVEVVLERCSAGTEGASEANAALTARGLRVLAVAVGAGPAEEDLRLVGLVGIADPPRPEAIEAVAQARAAGIRTIMITGDHPGTARAIAAELGIVQPDEDAGELVYARATPEDKLRLVRTWKDRGAVVAMTGDGVNDAPALREAHIGVAMGRTGTEVTREAADMVLADDNFASIVAAVREGRGIFDNIRKTLVYLLAGNAAELLVMFVAALIGLPLPLLPLHLLWINLVTDGLPALALVMDPADEDVLARPPRRPAEAMLGRPEWTTVVITGVLQAAVALGVFMWALEARDLDQARSLAFATLVFGELLRSFAARSPTRIFWEVGAFTNLRLLAVVALSVVLQVGIHELAYAREVFQLGPLGLDAWGLALACGLVPVTLIEVHKLLRRAARPAPAA